LDYFVAGRRTRYPPPPFRDGSATRLPDRHYGVPFYRESRLTRSAQVVPVWRTFYSPLPFLTLIHTHPPHSSLPSPLTRETSFSPSRAPFLHHTSFPFFVTFSPSALSQAIYGDSDTLACRAAFDRPPSCDKPLPGSFYHRGFRWKSVSIVPP